MLQTTTTLEALNEDQNSLTAMVADNSLTVD